MTLRDIWLKRESGIWLFGNGSRTKPDPFGFTRVVAGS